MDEQKVTEIEVEVLEEQPTVEPVQHPNRRPGQQRYAQYSNGGYRRKSNGIGTAGFILSLLFWIPFLGTLCWILAVIFSSIGLYRGVKSDLPKGLSIAGLVISLIGIVITIIFAGAMIASILGNM